jgi:hypothetical protein
VWIVLLRCWRGDKPLQPSTAPDERRTRLALFPRLLFSRPRFQNR